MSTTDDHLLYQVLWEAVGRRLAVENWYSSMSLRLHHLMVLLLQLGHLMMPSRGHSHLRHTLEHTHLLLHVDAVHVSLVHLDPLLLGTRRQRVLLLLRVLLLPLVAVALFRLLL